MSPTKASFKEKSLNMKDWGTNTYAQTQYGQVGDGVFTAWCAYMFHLRRQEGGKEGWKRDDKNKKRYLFL